MKKRFRAGIIGATGMVGQQFIIRLENHPWFTVTALAASPRSAGKSYSEAVGGRWMMDSPIPENIGTLRLHDAAHVENMAEEVDFVFCAVDMEKETVRLLEERYAKAEVPVISTNSANRWTPDVPMMIPEINPEHSRVIDLQRKRLKTKRGFISVKPNCSIQSYVPVLNALKEYGLQKVMVSNYQAISGAGKRFSDWPEMVENVIPYIPGEEAKSEQEPLKIWGTLSVRGIEKADKPVISAQCYRVPVADGHTSSVSVLFDRKPRRDEVIDRMKVYRGLPQEWKLPSAPKPFIQYFDEPDRPQAKMDCNYQNGMGISVGRLREDAIFHYKFTCLSHNTVRGAAGGAILTAEFLAKEGWMD